MRQRAGKGEERAEKRSLCDQPGATTTRQGEPGSDEKKVFRKSGGRLPPQCLAGLAASAFSVVVPTGADKGAIHINHPEAHRLGSPGSDRIVLGGDPSAIGGGAAHRRPQ